MLINPEKNIRQILQRNSSGSAKLLAQAEAIGKISHLIKAALPEELQQCVRVNGYQRGTLTLAAESANLLHPLRYQVPELLSQLRSQGLPGLISIKLEVSPLKASKNLQFEQPTPFHREADPRAASCLETSLPGIVDDELKAALAQLAEHLRNPDDQ